MTGFQIEQSRVSRKCEVLRLFDMHSASGGGEKGVTGLVVQPVKVPGLPWAIVTSLIHRDCSQKGLQVPSFSRLIGVTLVAVRGLEGTESASRARRRPPTDAEPPRAVCRLTHSIHESLTPFTLVPQEPARPQRALGH